MLAFGHEKWGHTVPGEGWVGLRPMEVGHVWRNQEGIGGDLEERGVRGGDQVVWTIYLGQIGHAFGVMETLKLFRSHL